VCVSDAAAEGATISHDGTCQTTIATSPEGGIWTDLARGPITVNFSEPVPGAVVFLPGAAYYIPCAGSPGTVTAYYIDGRVSTSQLQVDRSRCGYLDSALTWDGRLAAYTEFKYLLSAWTRFDGPGEITKIVITPPTVGEVEVCHIFLLGSQGETLNPPVSMCTTVPAYSWFFISFREFPTTAPANLTLSCLPASVVRGSTVTCTAGTEPAGAALRVTDWRFDPAAGTEVPAVTRTEDIKVWAGEVAVSGTVTVSGVVGTEPRTASQTIPVTPRDWSSQKVAVDVKDVSPGNLPDPPRRDEDLGNVQPVHQFIVPMHFITDGGPNEGYWYFTEIPVKLQFNVTINTNALREGSAFWRAHPVSPNRNLVLGRQVCTRSQLLTVVLQGVRKHEGFSRDDADSHVQTYTLELERQARTVFEPVVRSTADGRAFEQELTAIDREAQKQTNAVTHADARNPMRLTCTLDFSGRR
jgi:hypothetical protein